MSAVLLDTGAIVALLDQSERRHAEVAEAVRDIFDPLVTCEAVVAEACYLLRGVRGAQDAILANVERGIFQIPFHLGVSSAAVRRVMAKYRNVPMDLADGCLVVLAGELGTGRILTLDSDFLLYRWRVRRGFQTLVPIR